MGFLTLVLYIVLIGVIVWLVNRFAPIDQSFKTIILVVGIVIAILLVLYAFGILPTGDIPVPKLR